MLKITKNHKASFLAFLSFLFLLPLFFVPDGALPLASAKAALMAFGIVIVTLIFLLETWQEGKLDIPWHPFVLVTLLLPLVYLISALLSTPSSLSLLGYNFEAGTFGYMLFGCAFLVLVGMIFTNTVRILQALVAFLLSVSIVAIFMVIKVLFGLPAILGSDIMVWGNFFGNMGNPLGDWTDLGVVFGLLSVFTALILGMIPMRLIARALIYTVFVTSAALLVIINFFPAFILTLGASILLLFYFGKVEKQFFSTANAVPGKSPRFFLKPAFLPIILGLISVIFLINPTVSETRGSLGDVVANTFKINNTSVRPSFAATLSISKAVLSQVAFLGSGPNTFSHDWLIYKPLNVNATPFWATTFPFGIGFIPTQIASTGILGSTFWLAFFVFLIFLGIKVLDRIPESRAERFTLITVCLFTFYLWVSSFLYAPSEVMLMLSFIFSGLLVAASRSVGIVPSRAVALREPSRTRFISTTLVAIIALGALFLGWVGFEKTASALYFKRAIDLSNTTGTSLPELAAIEEELDRAISFAPTDAHYFAISRTNFAKAQATANINTGSPKENQATFEEAVKKSIEAARSAVSINPAGFQNWVSLGMIYSALVPAPLSVEGAYENARFAYNEALKKNPNNPELYLLLARLEFSKGNVEGARSLIRNAIALKEDYTNAYLMLAELEVGAGNTTAAIASAEKLALLVPNNPGLYFELGLLKYRNKDYAGAEQALSLALKLAPEYANARYYLGLTLSGLGRLTEAQKEFETLTKTNPNNPEVEAALASLRQGKSPIPKTQ
ncbi:MAG: tetratricopeptide repeat protein [Patescibacteria group bacterium]